MSYRSPAKNPQSIWLRTAFMVALAALTYGLQELEQSSISAVEVESIEVSLPELKEADFPQFLISMSEAAFNRDK